MRIGILDNDIFAINGIRAMLLNYQRKTGENLDIWYTDNPAKAIARCSVLPVTDVMLIDMALNGISGVQVTSSIRQSGSVTAIAGMTSYDSAVYAEALRQAGAQALVDKRELSSNLEPLLLRLAAGDKYPENSNFYAVKEYVALEHSNMADVLSGLSARELEILKLYKAKSSTKEIAERLNISEDTIFSHRRNIKKKFHLDNWSEVIAYCDHLNIL